jgi:hypothetical protein
MTNSHKIRQVVDVKILDGYKVELTFDNLRKGKVDLGNFLNGGIFEELKNLDNFKKLEVNSALGTIYWYNGADIAPDTLYSEAVKEDN